MEWSQWATKSKHGARRYEAIPFIADSAEFGIAVAKWWNEMQPASRRGDVSPVAVHDTGDGSLWDPLRRSGPNGLVSVMTLLVWWGQALLDRTQYQTDSSVEWRKMVIDVNTCLASILATTDERAGVKKRKAVQEKGKNSKR